MPDNFEEFKGQLPELLGDDFFNDPETKQQPTKYFDNVDSYVSLAKRAVNADRQNSAHGDELKKATAKATEGMIKIPGEGATVEEIAAYRETQGVPKDVSGYELPIPEDEENKAGNEAIAKEVAAAAHEAGIPKSKLMAVWNKVIPALAAQAQAIEKQGNDLLAADIQALKDTYKDKYDSFIADTDNVASYFDIKADPDRGIEENRKGSDFMAFLKGMGIRDIPVVREFLGGIIPLVIQGKTSLGAAPAVKGGDGWYTDYPEVDGDNAENP